METKSKITEKYASVGVYYELECCMCGECKTIAAPDNENLIRLIEEDGWTWLESDMYGLGGDYCGCNYED